MARKTATSNKKPRRGVGKTITFRLEAELRELLEERATAEFTSASALCNRLIDEGLRRGDRFANIDARLADLEQRMIAIVATLLSRSGGRQAGQDTDAGSDPSTDEDEGEPTNHETETEESDDAPHAAA